MSKVKYSKILILVLVAAISFALGTVYPLSQVEKERKGSVSSDRLGDPIPGKGVQKDKRSHQRDKQRPSKDFLKLNSVPYKPGPKAGQIIKKGTVAKPDPKIKKGTVAAANDGFIALLAKKIESKGVLKARQGKVLLSSGNKVTLSFEKDNLIQVAVDESIVSHSELESATHNTGTIQADSGEIIITANTVQDAFINVVNNEGIITADAIVEGEDGTISLLASGADIMTASTVTASGGKVIANEITGAIKNDGGRGTNITSATLAIRAATAP